MTKTWLSQRNFTRRNGSEFTKKYWCGGRCAYCTVLVEVIVGAWCHGPKGEGDASFLLELEWVRRKSEDPYQNHLP